MTKLNDLDLFFCVDYHINDTIIMKQPKIKDLLAISEEAYWDTVQSLTAIPSDMKSYLFDLGIDYESVSNIEFFYILCRSIPQSHLSLFFKDLILADYDLCVNKENDELVLFNVSNNSIIDRRIYSLIMEFLCKLHGITQKTRKPANAITKQKLIEEDRYKRQSAKKRKFKSQISPLVSSLINSQGFKYNSAQILDIGIYEFFDSVKRLSIIRQSDALLSGAYGGFIDFKSINKRDLDWTRST